MILKKKVSAMTLKTLLAKVQDAIKKSGGDTEVLVGTIAGYEEVRTAGPKVMAGGFDDRGNRYPSQPFFAIEL